MAKPPEATLRDDMWLFPPLELWKEKGEGSWKFLKERTREDEEPPTASVDSDVSSVLLASLTTIPNGAPLGSVPNAGDADIVATDEPGRELNPGVVFGKSCYHYSRTPIRTCFYVLPLPCRCPLDITDLFGLSRI